MFLSLLGKSSQRCGHKQTASHSKDPTSLETSSIVSMRNIIGTSNAAHFINTAFSKLYWCSYSLIKETVGFQKRNECKAMYHNASSSHPSLPMEIPWDPYSPTHCTLFNFIFSHLRSFCSSHVVCCYHRHCTLVLPCPMGHCLQDHPCSQSAVATASNLKFCCIPKLGLGWAAVLVHLLCLVQETPWTFPPSSCFSGHNPCVLFGSHCFRLAGPQKLGPFR